MTERDIPDPRRAQIMAFFNDNYYQPRHLELAGNVRAPRKYADRILGGTLGKKDLLTIHSILNELITRSVLDNFAPGYEVEIAPEEFNRNGIDLLIMRNNALVGGIDVKNSFKYMKSDISEYEGVERGILIISAKKNGARILLNQIAEHGNVNVNSFVMNRLEQGEGLSGLRQIGRRMGEDLFQNFRNEDFNQFSRVVHEGINNYLEA